MTTVLEASTDSLNSIDSRGRTTLFWAVIRDDHVSVSTLLTYGADTDIRDKRGCTAIDMVQSVEVCQILLDAGMRNNINAKGYNMSTVHVLAAKNSPVEIFNLMAQAGCDIDAVNTDNETPLLTALYCGHTEIAKRLIQLGANVNAVNFSSHDTAVHFASSFDRPDILPLLLEKGANYTALNIHGRNIGHNAARFASTRFIETMSTCNLKDLDLKKPDKEGKSAHDYINERIILADREIGVHEAFISLAASLQKAESNAGSKHETFDSPISESKNSHSGNCPIPGAFPVASNDEDN